ncbi:MAG: GGDEF domain-containing protein [Pseudohaliea sp.]
MQATVARSGVDDEVLQHIVELSSITDTRVLDRRFLDSVCALLPVDYALLCVFTPRGNMTWVRRYREPKSGTYQTCWQQQPLSSEQLALIDRAKQAPEGAHRAAPQGRELAAFSHHGERGRAVTLLLQYPASVDEARLAGFAAFLRTYFNFRAFMDASQRDPLTGLLNRRYFDDCIHRALEVIAEEKSPKVVEARRRSADIRSSRYWLAILDIDHFKRFNDAYGHLYGDEILLLFARIMEQTFREADLLFRFGGEEFVVLMENASAEEALAALERFRCAVEAYRFPQGERVTVSSGVTEALGECSATTLLGRADEALYYAKDHGRNRTVIYEELLASGERAGPARAAGSAELF